MTVEIPRNISKSKPETDKRISKPEIVQMRNEQTPTATIPLGFPEKEKEDKKLHPKKWIVQTKRITPKIHLRKG